MVTAAPEIWQYYLLGKKLADYYRLPSQCIISGDSKLSDIQLAMEKFSGMLISVLCGINLIHGCICQMDGMNGATYEQILIDDEIMDMIKHMIVGGGICEKDTDYEVIFKDIKQSLGNPMYFMNSDVTVKEFKKKLWMSNLLIRENFDTWKENGMRSIIDNSVGKAKKILDSYKVKPLERAADEEIKSIVEKSRARAGR